MVRKVSAHCQNYISMGLESFLLVPQIFDQIFRLYNAVVWNETINIHNIILLSILRRRFYNNLYNNSQNRYDQQNNNKKNCRISTFFFLILPLLPRYTLGSLSRPRLDFRHKRCQNNNHPGHCSNCTERVYRDQPTTLFFLKKKD